MNLQISRSTSELIGSQRDQYNLVKQNNQLLNNLFKDKSICKSKKDSSPANNNYVPHENKIKTLFDNLENEYKYYSG